MGIDMLDTSMDILTNPEKIMDLRAQEMNISISAVELEEKIKEIKRS